MNTFPVTFNAVTWLECREDGGALRCEADALDLVAACGMQPATRLLVPAACLSEDFFRLGTRLAGDVLQKLANYRLRAAFLVPAGHLAAGRFAEMALEANRGRQFHFCAGREEAQSWLAGLEETR